ncbi:MAG: hypothetical protein LBT49_01595 [Prevotellaceae bacterium]|jgi:hypothetical protein|nr:hypothetical protein [Prevotellaceae bacterium]
MNIYEKVGDFLLNLTQLTVGGIIFTLIVTDKAFSSAALYSMSGGVAVALFIFAIILFRLGRKYIKKE